MRERARSFVKQRCVVLALGTSARVSDEWVVRYLEDSRHVYFRFNRTAYQGPYAIVDDPSRADLGPEMLQKLKTKYRFLRQVRINAND